MGRKTSMPADVELQLMVMMTRGMTNPEMGSALGVSASAVVACRRRLHLPSDLELDHLEFRIEQLRRGKYE